MITISLEQEIKDVKIFTTQVTIMRNGHFIYYEYVRCLYQMKRQNVGAHKVRHPRCVQ